MMWPIRLSYGPGPAARSVLIDDFGLGKVLGTSDKLEIDQHPRD